MCRSTHLFFCAQFDLKIPHIKKSVDLIIIPEYRASENMRAGATQLASSCVL